MRNEPAVAGRQPVRHPAGYPAPAARHPVYMYGVFPRGTFPGSMPAICPCSRADEAMLGIREAAGALPPDIHPHHHADVRASDSHAFIFGVAAEQSPVVPPDNPAHYFWDVGSA